MSALNWAFSIFCLVIFVILFIGGLQYHLYSKSVSFEASESDFTLESSSHSNVGSNNFDTKVYVIGEESKDISVELKHSDYIPSRVKVDNVTVNYTIYYTNSTMAILSDKFTEKKLNSTNIEIVEKESGALNTSREGTLEIPKDKREHFGLVELDVVGVTTEDLETPHAVETKLLSILSLEFAIISVLLGLSYLYYSMRFSNT